MKEVVKTICLAQHVRDLSREKYNAPLRAYAEASYNQKLHLREDKCVVLERTIPARDLLRLYSSAVRDPDFSAAMLSGLKHHGDVEGSLTEHSFYGMKPDSYAEEITGQRHKLQDGLSRAQEELARTGIKESLEELSVGARKRRRRVFSDCEGEFHYDRRQEDQPFSRTITHKKEYPFIELIYPAGMNNSASLSELQTFSARCLALAEILEGVGYRVGITAEVWGMGCVGGLSAVKRMSGGSLTSKYSVYDVGRFPLREASEYGDLLAFAPIACAEFFRRAVFLGHLGQVHHAYGLTEELGNAVSYGLGSSINERPLPPAEGQLVLTHSIVGSLFSIDKVQREKMFKDYLQHTLTGKQESLSTELTG